MPSAPDPPSSSNRTSNSVKLTWSAPFRTNGLPLTLYEVQYGQFDDGNDTKKITDSGDTINSQLDVPSGFSILYTGMDTAFKVTVLSPGTRYAFRVRARNEIGFGPWSGVHWVKTGLAPPGPPTEVHVCPDGLSASPPAPSTKGGDGSPSAAILIEWQVPASNPLHAKCTSYEIEATPLSGGSSVKCVCGGKSTTRHRLVGLRPSTEYSVRVRGIGTDGAGHGAWSITAVVTTATKSDGALAARATCASLDTSLSKSSSGMSGSGNVDAESSSLLHSTASGNLSDTSSPGNSPATSVGSSKVGSSSSSSSGKKVAIAKTKPKQKTWMAIIARSIGVKEYHVVLAFYALIAAFIAMILLW